MLSVKLTVISWNPVTASTVPTMGSRIDCTTSSGPNPTAPQELSATTKQAAPPSSSNPPSTRPRSSENRANPLNSRNEGASSPRLAAYARAITANPRPCTPSTNIVEKASRLCTSKTTLPTVRGPIDSQSMPTSPTSPNAIEG